MPRSQEKPTARARAFWKIRRYLKRKEKIY
nr:MAG TPA: hypothetical protein [Caudoviricetes sp.]